MMAFAATGWVGADSAALHLAEGVAASGGGSAALPYLFAGVSGAVAVAGVLTARSLYRRLKAAEAEADRLAWRLDHDLSSELAFIVKPGRLLPASPATLAFLETAAAAQARRDGAASARADLAALLGEAVAERLKRPVARLLKNGERFRLEAEDAQEGRWFVLGETVGSRAVLRLVPAFAPAAAEPAPPEAAAETTSALALNAGGARVAAEPEGDLRAMLGAAPAGVVAFDAERRLTLANETALRQLRLTESFAAGGPSLRAFLDQLHRRQRMPEQPNYSIWRDKVLTKPTTLAAPALWVLPNGDALRVWAADTPSGGFALFLSDETAALAAERRSKIVEGARRATIAAVDQGLALIGGEGSVQLLNPAFARIWGLEPAWCAEDDRSADQARGAAEARAGRLGLDQLAAAASRSGAADREIWARIETALLDQPRRIQRFAAERAAIGPDGRTTRRHLELQITPLPDGASLISCADVSDSRAAEQALRDRAEALRERAEALEAADRLKTDFLSDMAYQLRTPLNAVIGFTDMLNQGLAGPLQERQKSYVGYVLSAADDLRELISDALDLGALRAGSLTLRRGAFDLAVSAGAVASMAQRRAERRRCRFEADIAPQELPLFGDERRLRHALFGALSTALGEAESDDLVRLTVGPSGPGRAAVEVNLERARPRKRGAEERAASLAESGAAAQTERDQGEAIAAAEGERAEGLQGGLDGVSLSLARKIVEAHGGEATAGRDELGLWIRLETPLDPEAGAANAPTQEREAGAAAASAAAPRQRSLSPTAGAGAEQPSALGGP